MWARFRFYSLYYEEDDDDADEKKNTITVCLIVVYSTQSMYSFFLHYSFGAPGNTVFSVYVCVYFD